MKTKEEQEIKKFRNTSANSKGVRDVTKDEENVGLGRAREREREREREGQGQGQTDRQRDREGERLRQTDRQTDREARSCTHARTLIQITGVDLFRLQLNNNIGEMEVERKAGLKTTRKTDRQTERERERESDRQTERRAHARTHAHLSRLLEWICLGFNSTTTSEKWRLKGKRD